MAFLRLGELLELLEAVFAVEPRRSKALRERVNFIARSTIIVNSAHEVVARNGHDFHSTFRIVSMFGGMMLGLKVERCHQVVSQNWGQYLSVGWARAWLAAAGGSIASDPVMLVASDEGLEFGNSERSYVFVRFGERSDSLKLLSGTIDPALPLQPMGFRLLDLSRIAQLLHRQMSANMPQQVESFTKQALEITKDFDNAVNNIDASGYDNRAILDRRTPISIDTPVDARWIVDPFEGQPGR